MKSYFPFNHKLQQLFQHYGFQKEGKQKAFEQNDTHSAHSTQHFKKGNYKNSAHASVGGNQEKQATHYIAKKETVK